MPIKRSDERQRRLSAIQLMRQTLGCSVIFIHFRRLPFAFYSEGVDRAPPGPRLSVAGPPKGAR